MSVAIAYNPTFSTLLELNGYLSWHKSNFRSFIVALDSYKEMHPLHFDRLQLILLICVLSICLALTYLYFI